MYFVQADIGDTKMRYKRTKLLTILEEFKKTGMECARIVDHEYKNAETARNAFNTSIKRFGINGVRVLVNKNELYLVRVDP